IGRSGTDGTDEFNNLAAFGQEGVQFVTGFAAFFDEVGAEVGGVKFTRDVGTTVYHDDGDASIFGFLQNGFPTGLNNGGEADHVYTFGNVGADGGNLLFLFLLSV